MAEACKFSGVCVQTCLKQGQRNHSRQLLNGFSRMRLTKLIIHKKGEEKILKIKIKLKL